MSLRRPSPKRHCPPPPFGVWEAFFWGGKRWCTVWLLPCTKGGVEVYDVAGNNVSKSTCERLRKVGVALSLHTSPSHWNQQNCLYIAVPVLLWHLQHPTGEWPKLHPLKNFAMPRRECRAMFDGAASWVATPGNLTLRRTGWAPAVLKEFTKVARELPPVGGKGLVPFAHLTGNMVPLLMLRHIAIMGEGKGESEGEFDPDVPVSSTGLKGKRKGAPPTVCLNQGQTRPNLTMMPRVLYRGEGPEEEGGSLCRGKRKKKKTAPSPYSSCSGTEMGGGGQRAARKSP